jgi:hypothetical protein
MTRLATETARGFQTIHQNQAVLILGERPGYTLPGIILRPGQSQSLTRYNEKGILRERKVRNTKMIPVKCPPNMSWGRPPEQTNN